MMMSPQERWDRIARAMLMTAGVFLFVTLYDISQGEDARGLIMTILPGLISLGVWRLACWRRDA
jgi:FtsH-binding integral membrane protein